MSAVNVTWNHGEKKKIVLFNNFLQFQSCLFFKDFLIYELYRKLQTNRKWPSTLKTADKKNPWLNDFLPSANIIFGKGTVLNDKMWSCRRIGDEIIIFSKNKFFHEKFFIEKKNLFFQWLSTICKHYFKKNYLIWW